VRAGLGLLVTLAVGLAAWWAAQRFGESGPGTLGLVQVEPFAATQDDASLRRLSVMMDAALVRELRRGGLETAAPGGRGAEFRLFGAVDQVGGEHNVQARVVDRRGATLWAARYARDSGRLTGFEEEAANRVADALHCALSSRAAEPRRVSAPALSLLLDGCAVRRGADPAEVAEYVEATRKLVALAPELSIAHSQRAVALAVVALRHSQNGGVPEPGDQAAAAAAAGRALALNPRNGEAHFAIGISHGAGAHWLQREASFDRAAELSPELSVVRNYRVFLLREVGRLEEADRLNARTVASDRFSPTQLYFFALWRAAAGDLETSERMLQRLALIAPELAAEARVNIAFWGRDPLAALSAVRAAPAGTEFGADRACFEAYLLRLAQAEGRPLKGLPDACTILGPYRMRMLARQGDMDGAYANVPSAARFNTSVFFGPEMERFRADRRFMPLAARLGLVDYWISSGHWPDFCQEPQRPYDCRAAALSLK
jgi:tetratricopeptide (TPR) repeat protein